MLTQTIIIRDRFVTVAVVDCDDEITRYRVSVGFTGKAPHAVWFFKEGSNGHRELSKGMSAFGAWALAVDDNTKEYRNL